MTSIRRDFTDDLMEVADAVGVTRPEPLHPSVRGHLADDSLATMLTAWSHAAAGCDPDEPIPFVLVEDDELPGEECEHCAGQGCYERMVQGEVVDQLCSWCRGTGIAPQVDRGGEL